ncbi:MAG: protein phosphatase 2C domain-containing protein [Bryobacterales bacterium]|nr:protein phosphatase 2C domain-containing protein [Bryobacterales bacterium]
MKLIPGNAQHIGSRQQQQDAFGFSNLSNEAFRKHGGMLAVVADGMGGMAHGEIAARTALKTFLDSYQAKAETESIPDALLRSLHAANAAVFQQALTMGAAEDMGTTLVAAALWENQMFWISAGDSGIFLYRDEEFTQANGSHVFATDLDEKASQGMISREDALAHPEREALTSFLGMERLALIDRNLRPFFLREKDVVLLASDGLFKTLSFAGMMEAMEGDAQLLSEALVSRALAAEKPYQDNITVVAIRAEAERVSLAAPVESARASSVRPATGRPRPWMAMMLLAAALVAAGGYIYYMFSYDPGSRHPSDRADQPAQPIREGTAFDPAATPPVQRQPGQDPVTPPAAERETAPEPEGKDALEPPTEKPRHEEQGR